MVSDYVVSWKFLASVSQCQWWQAWGTFKCKLNFFKSFYFCLSTLLFSHLQKLLRRRKQTRKIPCFLKIAVALRKHAFILIFIFSMKFISRLGNLDRCHECGSLKSKLTQEGPDDVRDTSICLSGLLCPILSLQLDCSVASRRPG